MRTGGVTWLGLVAMLLMLLAPDVIRGASAPQEPKGPTTRFPNLPPIHDAIIYLPEGFASMPSSEAKNLFIAAPFNQAEKLLMNERYVHFNEPFISIIKLVYHKAYHDDAARLVEKELEDQRIVVEHREAKVFGAEGVVLHVRQFAQGTWFHKWISVYGNGTQTNVVVAAFPEKRKEQWSNRLRRVVELAKMGDRAL